MTLETAHLKIDEKEIADFRRTLISYFAHFRETNTEIDSQNHEVSRKNQKQMADDR